jgi:hypothetical protein
VEVDPLGSAAVDPAGAAVDRAVLQLCRVSVTVVGDGDGGGWSIGDAADDAVDVLEALGGALLVGLAVLVPLTALGAAAWFGTRGLRRRRREAPLDR